MKKLLVFLFLIYSNTILSQKEANIWYFGDKVGLDFNSGIPKVLTDGEMNAFEGCATISDKDGNLLFYTNGINVWNRNHEIMPNGIGLLGDDSSTHSAIVVPKPEDANIYYLFTVDERAGTNGFQYSVVDMSLDEGLGDIVDSQKNIRLISGLTTEKVTAVKHNIENFFWVITHKYNSDEFVAFKIDKDGLNPISVTSNIGSFIGGTNSQRAIGYIKIAPNGKRLAVAHSFGDGVASEIQIFDFDANTGLLSNAKTIKPNETDLEFPEEYYFYGLEFSLDSKLLYTTALELIDTGGINRGFVFQYDLEKTTNFEITNSKVKIFDSKSIYPLGIQLATNGKIYVSPTGRNALDVIDNPNLKGLACDYISGSISLGGRRSRIGLPVFIQSFFTVDILFQNNCFGDNTSFSLNEPVDTIEWNFDDISSGAANNSTEKEPTHTFTKAGSYTVTVTYTIDGKTNTISKVIEILEPPTIKPPTKVIVCDADDGFGSFDLTTKNNELLDGLDNNYRVTYYSGLDNFNTNIPIDTPESYTNKISFTVETIYARVFHKDNEDCFGFTSFEFLVAKQLTTPANLETVFICDDTSVGTENDGLIKYDLTRKNTEILNGESALDFRIQYFTSITLSDISEIISPIDFENTSSSQNIYIKVSNLEAPSCFSTTQFELNVNLVPQIGIIKDSEFCDDDTNGFFTSNLLDKNEEILNGQSPDIFEIKYYRGLDNFNNNIAIENPTSFTNTNRYTEETIYIRILNKENDTCSASANYKYIVYETPVPNQNLTAINACDNTSFGTDTDLKIQYDLTQKEAEVFSFQNPDNFIFTYFSDNSLTQKITNPTSYVNTNKSERIYVHVANKLNTSCDASTRFDINVYPLPATTSPIELKQCDTDTDGFTAFNLTEANSKIVPTITDEIFTYFESFVGADTNNESQRISNPTTYTNQIANKDIIWVRIENPSGCYRISEINLEVSTPKIPDTFKKSFYECDDFIDATNDNTDGVTKFNFSSVTKELKAFFTSENPIVRYYTSEADALEEKDSIVGIDNFRNTTPNFQTIYARVDSKIENNCLELGPYIELHVEPVPIANEVTIPRECDDDFDGEFSFDTTSVETTLLGGQTGMEVTYMDENGNQLPSPLPNPFVTKSQMITVRVTDTNSLDPDGKCFAETQIEFIVDKKAVANNVGPFNVCDNDLETGFSFNTEKIEETILQGQTDMKVSYFDENNNTLPSPLPNPFFTDSQILRVRVENELNPNCFDETNIPFKIFPKPDFELISNATLCLNNSPLNISISNPKHSGYSYSWEDQNGTIISSNANASITYGGIYKVTATLNGCSSNSKVLDIKESEKANFNETQIRIKDGSEFNTVQILTSNLGVGEYEYGILKEGNSTIDFQDSPIFKEVVPGTYSVYINDKNGCGITDATEISLIGFPSFFSPNNDATNETWNLQGLNLKFYPESSILIYNRFGELVAKLNPEGSGWDGTTEGKANPATDYWFRAELLDSKGRKRILTGNFSLLR